MPSVLAASSLNSKKDGRRCVAVQHPVVRVLDDPSPKNWYSIRGSAPREPLDRKKREIFGKKNSKMRPNFRSQKLIEKRVKIVRIARFYEKTLIGIASGCNNMYL